jgi:hypothetical protein
VDAVIVGKRAFSMKFSELAKDNYFLPKEKDQMGRHYYSLILVDGIEDGVEQPRLLEMAMEEARKLTSQRMNNQNSIRMNVNKQLAASSQTAQTTEAPFESMAELAQVAVEIN